MNDFSLRSISQVMNDKLEQLLKTKYPWLVAEWNGATWESTKTVLERRMHAVEQHAQELAKRVNDLENELLNHANGQVHRASKPKLPPPDQE